MKKIALFPLVLCVVAAPLGATDLLTGDGIRVTQDMVEAELNFRPPGLALQTTSNPAALRALIDDLYRREAVVAAAEKAGLLNDPLVRYRLERARKESLVAAMLEHRAAQLSAQLPDFEALARERYLAQRDRYRSPEQVDVSHILLKANTPEQKAARRAEAEAVRARLEAGEDFAAVAQTVSEDRGSAARGGALGWFGRGRMVPEFEQAAFALQQPGELSPLVASEFGWHILRLNQRRAAAERPFEAVRDGIRQELEQEYVREQMRNWYEDLTALDRVQAHQDAIDAFIAATVARAAANPNAPAASPAAGE